jgi:hypothetical protein
MLLEKAQQLSEKGSWVDAVKRCIERLRGVEKDKP